jgi:hypothetical protein
MSAFVSSCSAYVQGYVLGPVVQHLNNRGVSVTVEELSGVLQLPAARSSVSPVNSTSSVPSMAFGGGAVPPMAAAVVPTTSARKNTATSTPVAGRTCMYQFKRGGNKGQYCGKATAAGSDFCNSCVKSRKNLQKEMAAGGMPGAAPFQGAIPGMAGLPPGYGAPLPASTPAQGGQLSVVEFDEERGLFREPTHNFIIRQIDTGVVVVIGRLTEPDNRIVPLNAQEEATARLIGLVIGENATEVPVPVSYQPMAPVPMAIPPPPVASVPFGSSTTPMIPSATPMIPSAIPLNPVAFNTAGQQPLPVITPLSTLSGVPSIPSIPQINQG